MLAGMMVMAACVAAGVFVGRLEHDFWPVAAGVLLGFAIAGIGMINPMATTYIITDRQMIVRRGFFSRETDMIQWRSVRAVDVRQSLVDRIAGCASILVDVPGREGILTIANVPNKSADLIVRLAGGAQNKASSVPQGSD